jgi:hypothetical protein
VPTNHPTVAELQCLANDGLRTDGPQEGRVPGSETGPAYSVLTIAVFCDDSLEIPAVGSLATDDGSFDVALDGTLTTGGSAVASDGPSFNATAPFDESGFPAPEEPELDTFEDQRAFLQVAYLVDGATAGRAGWSGDREDGDSSESRAHYQIEW